MKRTLTILGLLTAVFVSAWVAFTGRSATFGSAQIEEVRASVGGVLAEKDRGIPFAIANVGGELFEVPDAFCQKGQAGQTSGFAGSINNPIILDLRFVEEGGIPASRPVYVSPSFTDREDWWTLKDGTVTFEDGVIYGEGLLEGFFYPEGISEGDGTPVAEEPVAFAAAIICQE